MKSILLASTAVVAMAGAASAEISWSGGATQGWNDVEQDGFYWDATLAVAASMALDNGMVAAADLSFVALSSTAISASWYLSLTSYVLSLTTETAGLYFGDTDSSADLHWSGAGEMNEDAFNETGDDVWTPCCEPGWGWNTPDAVLRGEVTFGTVTASLSYALSSNNETLTALQFAAVAEVGSATVILAYQDGDNDNGEVFGISGSTTFGGADVTVAYADNEGDNSLGFEVGYPVGPATIGFWYVAESAVDDGMGVSLDYASGPITAMIWWESVTGTENFGVEGAYDVGNGLVVRVGYLDIEGAYAGLEYALGENASLLVSYNDSDETGDPEYNEGTTVEVSFEF